MTKIIVINDDATIMSMQQLHEKFGGERWHIGGYYKYDPEKIMMEGRFLVSCNPEQTALYLHMLYHCDRYLSSALSRGKKTFWSAGDQREFDKNYIRPTLQRANDFVVQHNHFMLGIVCAWWNQDEQHLPSSSCFSSGHSVPGAWYPVALWMHIENEQLGNFSNLLCSKPAEILLGIVKDFIAHPIE